MELTKGCICTACGKNFSEVKGNCEINRDKDFYGGRVAFFQTKQCDCGRKYKLCIAQTGEGLKVIDMIILDKTEKVQGTKPVVKPDAILEEPVKEEEIVEEKEEQKRDYNFQLNPVVEETPSIIAEMDSAKSKLLMLTKKELHTLLRRRKISFNKNLATKEELVNKLLLRNPTGVGLFK